MNRLRSLLPALGIVLALPLMAQAAPPSPSAAMPPAVKRGVDLFSADAIKAHTTFLASDLLEGRGPGTRGDELAMEYIAAQFRASGVEPAGDNGTYFQKVALLGLTTLPEKTSLAFTKGGANVIGPLKHKDEYVGQDQTQVENDTIDSEVVFVGHGVVAPEYKWDDYKGLDTRGKTLVMLVDDPPASASEPELFKGKARTYYGRWTYKYEIGALENADAVILIHTGEAAGYPWSVVRNSWGDENSFMRNPAGRHALKFSGWITEQVAANLFKSAGQDLAALTRAAASRDFQPVPLGVRFSGNIATTIRPFNSANVVGKVVGSDAKLRDQAVLYSAHHDHLGIGTPDKNGDKIYNGAIDNGTGSALLIEMARVWANSRPAPKRSILFAAVAAEEQGLLGSAYYGQNPTIPAGQIALNINYDAIPELGRVSDVTMNGVERTTFYPTAQRITKAMGVKIVPDQEPEQGHYYRSDHFSLGKVGIPAFSLDAGQEVIGKPAGWGKERSKDYRENHYHQPSDEVQADWDWSTAVEMGQLGYWLGWDAANAATMPNWVPGDEFRAIRDKSLK
ncbi:MAG: peptidase [Acidobacteria bacterium]|nr:peptidase [Acidobacteriota bacterium]